MFRDITCRSSLNVCRRLKGTYLLNALGVKGQKPELFLLSVSCWLFSLVAFRGGRSVSLKFRLTSIELYGKISQNTEHSLTAATRQSYFVKLLRYSFSNTLLLSLAKLWKSLLISSITTLYKCINEYCIERTKYQISLFFHFLLHSEMHRLCI